MKYNFDLDMTSENSLSLILKNIEPNSVVLEFGPANGRMTKYLKEQLNCKVYIVELDEVAGKEASVYAEQCVIGDIEQYEWHEEFQDVSFDYVVFADVLEHLYNPWDVLNKVQTLLKEEGSIFISIPNIAHNSVIIDLLNNRFDYKKTGLLDNTHIRFFTYYTLLEMLESTGLSPLKQMATYARVGENEFSNTYLDVLGNVETFLRIKEFGEVYQFVVEAKKSLYVEKHKLDVNKLKTRLLKQRKMQLYVDIGTGFHEDQSIIQECYDHETQISFDLSRFKNIQAIRLDPAESEVMISINQIWLDTENHLTTLDFAETNAEYELDKVFFFNNNDPQILFDIPVGENIKKFVIDFQYLAFSQTNSLVAEQLLSKVKEIQLEQKKLTLQLQEETNQKNILKEEIYQLQKSIEAFTHTNATLKISLERREQEKQSLLNSTSWKLSAPVRALGRTTRFIRRKIITPRLVPAKDLEPVNNDGYNWVSTGSDPHFILEGQIPTGWTFLSMYVKADELLNAKLYIDSGKGFNEQECIDIGYFGADREPQQSRMFYLEPNIQSLRLDMGEDENNLYIKKVRFIQISRARLAAHSLAGYLKYNKFSIRKLPAMAKKVIRIASSEGFSGLKRRAKLYLTSDATNKIAQALSYEEWVAQHTLTAEDQSRIKEKVESLSYKPLFSIIVPVYNVDEKWLRKCIESVRGQLYPYWELCIADDASPKPHIKRVLDEYCTMDSRIKVVYREKNGHISAASNSALELATGEFIALLDNDDELTPDALYENALLLNKHPEADMIYSDEDKIDENGKRNSPFFKPDWSPDLILSQMYTCHFGVYRSELVHQIGGFRIGFEGSQDYDFVLRFTERTKNIFHIPKVLYHWRTLAESTASGMDAKGYAHQAGLKAIEEALERRGEKGRVETVVDLPGRYRVRYQLENKPLISIIIPTRDKADILKPCLNSIFNRTTYENFEVIIADNGSLEQETIDLFNEWREKEPNRFRVLRLDMPFNYSRINNEAVSNVNGELILLLNNDVEVLTEDWLEEMASQAMRGSVGAVGAKLLYPDDTLQHAGIILGIGGVAGHSHKYFSKDAFGYFDRLLLISNYSAVTGACLMVRKELFEQVGGLDQTLEVAFNDVDFCLKLCNQGFYNVLLPDVVLYHYESKSRGLEDTPEKIKRFQGEITKMKKKWSSLLSNDPFYNNNLTLDSEDFTLRRY